MPAIWGLRKHARFCVTVVGLAMIVLGLIGIVRVFLLGDAQDTNLLDISQTAFIAGVLMTGQSLLFKRKVSEDQQFWLGHDIGEQKGFREGRRTGTPVVVPLRRPCEHEHEIDHPAERKH